MTQGEWKITVNESNGNVTIYKADKCLLADTHGAFKIGATNYEQNQLSGITVVAPANYSDDFGSGKKFMITSKTSDDQYTITHNYYLYNDYILTDLTIQSDQIFASNYLAPVKTATPVAFLPAGDNRDLFVPFDNDGWIRYRSEKFGSPMTSYEAGALYNADSNQGLVVGSIEHTVWKTGIKTTTGNGNQLLSLEAFGGITSNETRDNLPHGAVKGTLVKSPKIFIGYFADWRTGLETFADVNAIFAPKLPWNAGKPFVWNSWGVIQTSISYGRARQVSDWIAQNIQNNNFHDEDGIVYIDLDSYWDRLDSEQLYYFVQYCQNNNQYAGVYWTPFVDWGNNANREVEGTNGQYKYGELYLYANGQKQLIAGAPALDPTHPGTKIRMDYILDRFKNWGYKFIKLDFMVHGELEADSHYDPDVHTGIQAYNQGMKYIADKIGNSMYINLSISSLFPANYAHGRRIACDAYTEAEYTLNSLTYGWWLDHVYSYNDADNVVFNNIAVYDGINRQRVISSAITGIFCIGDDFTSNGDADAKDKATRMLTNTEINRMARQTKAFRPLQSALGNNAAEAYYTTVADTTYVALFNMTAQVKSFSMDFQALGLTPGTNYTVQELWRNERIDTGASWSESVPRFDVDMLKIYPKSDNGIDRLEQNTIQLYPNPCRDQVNLSSNEDIKKLTIYSSVGLPVKEIQNPAEMIAVDRLSSGVYLVKIENRSGVQTTIPLIKQ
ncbi:MAG: T9SS type A sorting domain-containing protein [Dysgonamonadaceae bacterium]|nr:T9SS type A sorting domain-containing protein [Dysgonamonadaceae bacterium]